MENYTLGQIAVTGAFIIALVGGYTSLKKLLTEGIEKMLKDKFESIEKTQKEILKRIDTVDLENCKNYLVTFLAEISRGERKDDTEIMRFWEEYQHYESKGGNSYIHRKVDELKERGLL